LAEDKIGCESLQPIELTLGPAVFHCNVLTLDKPDFFQAFVECDHERCVWVERRAAEKPNHLLLRPKDGYPQPASAISVPCLQCPRFRPCRGSITSMALCANCWLMHCSKR